MTNGSDAAFPNSNGYRIKVGENERDKIDVSGGLTKREYFAGLAMQGLIADVSTIVAIHKGKETMQSLAIMYADALIDQLNK